MSLRLFRRVTGCSASAFLLLLPCLLIPGLHASAEQFDVPLANPGFEEGIDARGVPMGWELYGRCDEKRKLRIATPEFGTTSALLIEDADPAEEVGVVQTVSVRGGVAYEVSLDVGAVKSLDSVGAHVQLRFHPSGTYAQTSFGYEEPGRYSRLSAKGMAPDDTTRISIYLYTHREPTPHVYLDNVKLTGGVPPPPAPPPPPPDMTAPTYTELKALYLDTAIVAEGKPEAVIVKPASGLYDSAAARIHDAIRELTGVSVRIVADDAAEAGVPSSSSLILLGNRSTHRTINTLYDLYYTLLGLRYPGPGGHVVRTLHDPFANGRNVVLVGGSDAAGVNAAADVLCRELGSSAGGKGALTLGPTMRIRLGNGIVVPTDVREFEIWEASAGYRSVGYFGWNSISKRMAMYYMTGDEFHAREFLRLAFPDEQALKDIAEIDGERIEDKSVPLSGAYHYNKHMLILYWDLIEESPVFTDADRLRVTNAFAKQLEHTDYALRGAYTLTRPPSAVGSRHGQWGAISLYCLGRYFQKYYPAPIWDQCVNGAKLHFAPLHRHAWVNGESDNLFWYSTGIAPIFTYMVLTGDREPLENGVIRTLLRGQEALLSGKPGDRQIGSASLGFLHKAAYVTGDGRWLHYRERTGVKTDIFRLGQSFWPAADLEPSPPTDLMGKWTINSVPMPLWRSRQSGLALEHSFLFGSYRSAYDGSGDFVLLDGFNGASRNPYHTFAILDLRIDGTTLLEGYHNQVLTSADGMVEPKVAMDAGLLHSDVLGQSVVAIGEVPKAAYSNWRRVLVQRVGCYALVIDDLTFRTDSGNMRVATSWGTVGGRWSAEENAIEIRGRNGRTPPPGWHEIRALASDCRSEPDKPGSIARLDGLDIVLLRATEPGWHLDMPFALKGPVTGEVYVDFLRYVDRGVARVQLDGHIVADSVDLHADGVAEHRISIGQHSLAAGQHVLRVEAIGKHPGVDRCYVALRGVAVRLQGAPVHAAPSQFGLHPADLTEASGSGVVTTQWDGAVREGEHRIQLNLLARGVAEEPGRRLGCWRVAENAAVLALPQAGLAVIGGFEQISAGMCVFAEDHLYAHELVCAGLGADLISADEPVDVDWDFASGVLNVAAVRQTALRVHLAAGTACKLDGEPVAVSDAAAGTVCALGAGRHVFGAAFPHTAASAAARQRLSELTQSARAERERLRRASADAAVGPAVSKLPTVATVALGKKQIAHLTTLTTGTETHIVAAQGQEAHLLTTVGARVRSLKADADIRNACWWPEEQLLLVGCVDEQVIAFDETGTRKWAFVSEMDPAVYRAAKTYWFKTAPGHHGVHGLRTGTFSDGKSQCFVGSACTLEIIDGAGKLVKRMPVFWGPGWQFQLMPGPDDSVNLLIARWPNGNDTLAVVNSRTLSVQRGFYGVPTGHTFVGGWSAQNRVALLAADMDDDGQPELVAPTNGTWNRVTVYSTTGKPLYNAQFGPGKSNRPRSTMRAVVVADLDGDGKQEIVVGTADGLVVALDYRCAKLWGKRVGSAPSVLKCVTPTGSERPWIVVGCDDGRIEVLDGGGNLVRRARVAGRPLSAISLGAAAQPAVAMGTAEGHVTIFAVR